jgi:hypothetical protein
MKGYTNFTKVHADEFNGRFEGNLTGKSEMLNFVATEGVTIEALTDAIGNPANLPDGTFTFIQDTEDSDAIRAVVVIDGKFYYGGKYSAAEAADSAE